MSESLKERAYSHVYRKLIRGEFVPGTRLSSRALAAEMGMSMIPVREAVSRLQSEGLVEHRSGVGSFVPMPNYEELLEIYDLREAIECHAAAKVSQSLSDADAAILRQCVDQMRALLQKLDKRGRLKWSDELVAEWSKLDAQFHDTIMLAAGNRRALDTIRNLRDVSRVFGRRVAGQPMQRLQQTLDEHAAILDALEHGKSDKAFAGMSIHIRGGVQSLLQMHRRERVHQDP